MSLMRTLQNRIPPPIVMALFGVIMFYASKALPSIALPNSARTAMVLTFLLLAAVMLVSGAISFRLAKTTVNPLQPDNATSLVTTGIYRITRNPMYVGFVFLLVAWTFYLNAIEQLVFVFGYGLYIQYLQIKPEEEALMKLFGDEFKDYKSRVRTWL